LVEADDLRKQYGRGKEMRAAVDGVSLEVERGEFVAIVGPSGCGKSTLLGILGGLDRSYQGRLRLFGADTAGMSDRELATVRGTRIGFVFQAFHLLGHLSARDNILAPTLFRQDRTQGVARRWHARADQLLADLGLEGRGGDMPAQLSGGERQRVAIARAMLLEPELLLCDEPTGNLDQATGSQIVEVFSRLHESEGLTVVGVTHDVLLTSAATRVLQLRRGQLVVEPEGAADVDSELATTADEPPQNGVAT
jgi:putative ABC transport system ATP-binding protein